jgi:hypothetical protein
MIKSFDFNRCSIGDQELVSQKALPGNTTAFLVYIFRDKGGYRDNHSASDLVEFKQ